MTEQRVASDVVLGGSRPGRRPAVRMILLLLVLSFIVPLMVATQSSATCGAFPLPGVCPQNLLALPLGNCTLTGTFHFEPNTVEGYQTGYVSVGFFADGICNFGSIRRPLYRQTYIEGENTNFDDPVPLESFPCLNGGPGTLPPLTLHVVAIAANPPRVLRSQWVFAGGTPFPSLVPITGNVVPGETDPARAGRFVISTRIFGMCPPNGRMSASITFPI